MGDFEIGQTLYWKVENEISPGYRYIPVIVKEIYEDYILTEQADDRRVICRFENNFNMDMLCKEIGQ